MTTSTRPQARHRSAASAPAITALTASVATGARRYRQRSAVIAASSGLVVTMGLPAAAVAAPQADEAGPSTAALPAAPAPVESATTVIDVAPTAQVDLAMGQTASVDSSEAERREAAAAAAAAARAEVDRVAAQAAQAARASATSTALASRAAAPQVSRSTDRGTGGAVATAAVVATPGAAAPVAAAPAAAPSASGGGAIAIGQRYTGVPYVYGGTTPSGFDCSGFVQYVYRQMGISLPRTAAAQASAGRRVSASEARPGDIVSFTGGGGVYHNGLYVGNGQMLDAPRTGKSVGVRSIWSTSVTFTRVG